MKVIEESKYRYSGTFGDYHVFECIVPGFSAEKLCVAEARYKRRDGSNVFFNTITYFDENRELTVETFKRSSTVPKQIKA